MIFFFLQKLDLQTFRNLTKIGCVWLNLKFHVCGFVLFLLEPILTKAGATFDNSFFDNCFDLVQQLKNRSFLGPFSVHKVKISISRTNSGQQLYSINVLFDFFLT
jgi:hypothetical protein